MAQKETSQRGYAAALTLAAVGGAASGRIGHVGGGVEWLCCIAGSAVGAVFFLLLGRLAALRPSDAFFGSIRAGLGKVVGGAVSLAMSVLALRLCAHEVALTGEFISSTLLDGTSAYIIGGALTLLCAAAAAGGESTLTHWAELMMPPTLLVIAIALLLAVPDLKLSELIPQALAPTVATRSVLEFFLSSFCGGIGCAVLLFRVKVDRSRVRSAMLAIAASTVTMTLIYMWNTALLGSDMLDEFNFPTYHALRVIGLSSLEVRLEALLTLPIVLMSFMRASTFLLMSLRGAGETLGFGGRIPAFLFGAAVMAMIALFYPNQSVLEMREDGLQLWTGILFVLPVIVSLVSCLIRAKARR